MHKMNTRRLKRFYCTNTCRYRLSKLALLTIIAFYYLSAAAYADALGQQRIFVIAGQYDKRATQLTTALSQALAPANIHLIDLSCDNLPADGATVIATGHKVLDEVLKSGKDYRRIIGVFISRVSYEQMQKNGDGFRRAHVVLSDPSPLQQLSLIRILYGRRAQVGILLSDKTQFMRNELMLAAKQANVKLYFRRYDPDNEKWFRRLLSQFVDFHNFAVFLAVPDDNIYNTQTTQWLIRSAFRHKVAIIGYSPQFVQLGAVATVYSNIEHTAHHLKQILSNPDTSKGKVSYNQNFDVITNKRFAKRRGFNEQLTQKIQNFIQSVKQ